jgi:ADP-ribosylglycohydrolase
MMQLTNNQGIRALKMNDWIYSDDTVMHIATAEALLKANLTDSNQ